MATTEYVKSILMQDSPTLYDPMTKAALVCYLGEGYPTEEDEPGIALSLVDSSVLLDALSQEDVEHPDALLSGDEGALDVISDGIAGYGSYLHYGTDAFNMFVDAMAVSFDEPGRWLKVPSTMDSAGFFLDELTYVTGRQWESPFVSDLMEKGEPVQDGSTQSVMCDACLFSPARGVFIGYEESTHTPGTYDLAIFEVPGRELAEHLGSGIEYDWPYDEAAAYALHSTYLPIQGHEEELRQLVGGLRAEQSRWVSYEGLGFEEMQDEQGHVRIEEVLQARRNFARDCARSQHVQEVRDVLYSLSDHLASINGFLRAMDADTAIDAVIADAYRDAVAGGEPPEAAAKSIASDLLLSLVAATTPDVDGRTMFDEQETVPLTTLAEIAVSQERNPHETR